MTAGHKTTLQGRSTPARGLASNHEASRVSTGKCPVCGPIGMISRIKLAGSERLRSTTRPVRHAGWQSHSLHGPQQSRAVEPAPSCQQARHGEILPGGYSQSVYHQNHPTHNRPPVLSTGRDCWDFDGAGSPGSAALFQPRPSPFYVSALLRISFGGGRKGGSSSPRDQWLLLLGTRAAECYSSPYGWESSPQSVPMGSPSAQIVPVSEGPHRWRWMVTK